jgi:hypothetical protein
VRQVAPSRATFGEDPRVAEVRAAVAAMQHYRSLDGEAQAAAGVRLEEEVFPAVKRAVDGTFVYDELRAAVFDFLVAAEGSASEEISGIGVRLYEAGPDAFCLEATSRPAAEREEVMMRARTGRALEGRATVVACPPPAPSP